MFDLRATVQKIVSIGVGGMICAGALSACKTTEYRSEKVVDISETHIILPESLLKLDGFKIKEAKILSLGSLVSEVVKFSGGSFYYQRYFHGGYLATNKDQLSDEIANSSTDYQVLKAPQVISGSIGDMYYATVYDTEKDLTCVVGTGNYGVSIRLRRGMGYPGRTRGEYCEKGRKTDLDQEVVKWLKRIRLRS